MPFYRFSTTLRDTVFDADLLYMMDDNAAWEEATIACGEIIKDIGGSLRPNCEWRMDVADEFGMKVFSLRLLTERFR